MKLGCILIVLLFDSSFSLFWGSVGFGSEITYQLYTRLNPVNGQPLIYGDTNSLLRSNFNNARATRIIVHGFGQNGRSNINRDLKNGYLSRGDFNVIVTDWSFVSSAYYQYARNQVGSTGVAVAKFIEWMNINYETLNIAGYDLGAHVAGIAGKNSVRGRISRIVALDPVLALFNENMSGNRLSTGDAQLVEVFHSNGGQLGMFRPIGDTDYYINNGRTQPECAAYDNGCSHYRAVTVFSRLLNRQNNYAVVACEDIAEVATGCSKDTIEIDLDEISPSGIYQISTLSAEAINKEIEEVKDV